MNRDRSRGRKAGNLAKLHTLAALDGRTAASRDARALIAALVSDAGGEGHISTARKQLAARAAVVALVCEHYEACFIAGDRIVMSEYFEATNALRRLLVSLGLERRAKPVEDLQQFLKRRARASDITAGADDD